ncbi:MAG: sensor histidine kinase [Bacillus sp. (in: Bacteria)]|nr:sensor histidine kinase [Bacillus sp. (in: firmicutes)]
MIAELAYRTDKKWSLPFLFLSYFSYIFAVSYHFDFPPFYEITYVIPRFIEYILFWALSYIARYAVKQKEQLAIVNKELNWATEELEKRTLLQERMRLSKEIHDTVGHTLTTALFGIESAKHVINKGNVSQGVEQLENSTYQIKRSLEDVRSIVHTMNENNTFCDVKKSLIKLIKETEIQSGVTISFEIAEPLPKLTPEQDLAIYRSLQEGITNGIRHGRSKRFHYLLNRENNGLHILLEDEGVFNGNVIYGFGLKAMETRLHLLGGSLNIFQNQYGGCSVEIFLPIGLREGQSVEEGA